MKVNQVTVGNFTGVWKSRRTAASNACLWNEANETRCGMTRRPGDILVKPARWAVRCQQCASPAYCPDCGDTATQPHRDDCHYDGQR